MDQSRVVLEGCAEDGFIHANWIQMNKDNFNDRVSLLINMDPC